MPAFARLTFAAAMVAGAITAGSVAPAAAQTDCHPAYGGCLPYYEGDAMNCADIGEQVVQVWDPYWDPYNLDTLYGVGNGWTCDGIG